MPFPLCLTIVNSVLHSHISQVPKANGPSVLAKKEYGFHLFYSLWASLRGRWLITKKKEKKSLDVVDWQKRDCRLTEILH